MESKQNLRHSPKPAKGLCTARHRSIQASLFSDFRTVRSSWEPCRTEILFRSEQSQPLRRVRVNTLPPPDAKAGCPWRGRHPGQGRQGSRTRRRTPSGAPESEAVLLLGNRLFSPLQDRARQGSKESRFQDFPPCSLRREPGPVATTREPTSATRRASCAGRQDTRSISQSAGESREGNYSCRLLSGIRQLRHLCFAPNSSCAGKWQTGS